MAIDSSSGMASAGTKLFYSKTDDVAPTEVADVKTTPEVGVQPQQLEVTNLGDETQQYDLGMNNSTALAFSVVYKGPTWNKIYANSGNRVIYNWKLVYPDGMYITFSGPFQVTVQGLDINTPLAYTISISPTVVPKFHKSASDESSGGEEIGGDSMGYRPMFVKTFSSVAAMNSYDDSDDSLIQGDFVLVNGTDADRGKVYFYNGSNFTFFANIIGPQGVQGVKGDPGLSVRMKGKVSSLPALANEGELYFVGTTLYSYTNGQWINLGDFKGDKGDKGDIGPTGKVGPMPDMTEYATESDVTKAVSTATSDSVKWGDQVGGRNLLLGTETSYVGSFAGSGDSFPDLYKYSFVSETNSGLTTGDVVTWHFDWSTNATAYGDFGPYIVGQSYDVIKSTGMSHTEAVTPNSSMKSGHASITVKLKAPINSSSYQFMRMYVRSGFIGTLTISNMMLEKGNVEHDYVPALENLIASSQTIPLPSGTDLYTLLEGDRSYYVNQKTLAATMINCPTASAFVLTIRTISPGNSIGAWKIFSLSLKVLNGEEWHAIISTDGSAKQTISMPWTLEPNDDSKVVHVTDTSNWQKGGKATADDGNPYFAVNAGEDLFTKLSSAGNGFRTVYVNASAVNNPSGTSMRGTTLADNNGNIWIADFTTWSGYTYHMVKWGATSTPIVTTVDSSSYQGKILTATDDIYNLSPGTYSINGSAPLHAPALIDSSGKMYATITVKFTAGYKQVEYWDDYANHRIMINSGNWNPWFVPNTFGKDVMIDPHNGTIPVNGKYITPVSSNDLTSAIATMKAYVDRKIKS
ncbi:hypothetical protein [Levilactobacillus enshiensis]|uniref:hypothetical protein n=1 Tax=Levilactobacillus enshiensis TaxID=2590213 RepID=UPI00117A6C60|nr:hypothetical protein [Levilactobacillus enshiensis]